LAHHNFKELLAWQKARKLVKETYKVSANFPQEERYGLTSQLRRAIVSVPTNIAEGCGRGGDKELAHFLDIAFASAYEVETLLILSYDLQFIDEANLETLTNDVSEVQRMIYSLIKKFRPNTPYMVHED
jgi:four helix bundle protein